MNRPTQHARHAAADILFVDGCPGCPPPTFRGLDLCRCGHDGFDGHDMRDSSCMTPGCWCGVWEAQQGATLHPVGDRWMVRIVTDPDAALYHGMRPEDRWSRNRQPYETGTMVEVYDRNHTGPQFTAIGQFVTAYGARTLVSSGNGATDPRRAGGLSLQGDVPAWTLTAEEFTALLGLIVQYGDLSL